MLTYIVCLCECGCGCACVSECGSGCADTSSLQQHGAPGQTLPAHQPGPLPAPLQEHAVLAPVCLVCGVRDMRACGWTMLFCDCASVAACVACCVRTLCVRVGVCMCVLGREAGVFTGKSVWEYTGSWTAHPARLSPLTSQGRSPHPLRSMLSLRPCVWCASVRVCARGGCAIAPLWLRGWRVAVLCVCLCVCVRVCMPWEVGVLYWNNPLCDEA